MYRKKNPEQQKAIWLPTSEIVTSEANSFYQQLDRIVKSFGFGDQVRAIYAPYYADISKGRRPGIDPEVRLKIHLIGFFTFCHFYPRLIRPRGLHLRLELPLTEPTMNRTLFLIALLFTFLTALNAPAQWQQVQIPEFNGNRSVYGITSNATYLFATGTDSALMRSTDNGATWERPPGAQFAYPGDANVFAYGNSLFLGLLSNGPEIPRIFERRVYSSRNDGESWTLQHVDLFGDTKAQQFLVHHDTLFCAGEWGAGWLNGDRWVPILITNSQYHFIFNMVIRENDWLMSNVGVIRSSDNGKTWMQLDTFNRVSYAIFASEDYILLSQTSRGILRTTDNGITWASTDTLFKSHPYFVYQFQKVNNVLFAATQRGVLRSLDDGQSWSMINTGLSMGVNDTMSVVTIHVHDNLMFIGTDKHGLWKRPLSELIPGADVAVTGRPSTVTTLSTPIPNPASESTIIDYQLPRASMVSLKLYDLYAHEIRTLVEGDEGRGVHQVVITTGDLPSGSYLYRLVSDGSVLTRQLMILH